MRACVCAGCGALTSSPSKTPVWSAVHGQALCPEFPLKKLSKFARPLLSLSPGRRATGTTTTSADFSLRQRPSGLHPQGEISPGKNALLRCTNAGSTPPRLYHESFAVLGPLALLGSAFYPVLVHRLAASLHASFPHSVALMQLRFTSFLRTIPNSAPSPNGNASIEYVQLYRIADGGSIP